VNKPVLYDNDALLKLSAYGCAKYLSDAGLTPGAILAVACWSLRSQAKRWPRVIDRERLCRALDRLIGEVEIVEPTAEEIELAAEFEERSNQSLGRLDGGESQLLAVLIRRGWRQALTGDKRAIVAASTLNVPQLNGKLICLEQAMLSILDEENWEAVRQAVCAEPEADKAIALAFACGSSGASLERMREGLSSYVGHLRGQSGDLLAA
jgi:hypothetical protein